MWPLIYLTLGIVALYLNSSFLCQYCGCKNQGSVLTILSLFTFAAGSIVLSCQVLGYTGILSSTNLLYWQGIQLGITLLVCRHNKISLRLTEANIWIELKHSLQSLHLFERSLFFALCLITTIIFLGALFGTPTDFDSHGYRLSRIGLWLQEANLFHSSTSDIRMNYSAFNGDLLMLWFTAPFKIGFPFVIVVQAIAGIFTLLSVWALARLIGYSQLTGIFAMCLLFSMTIFMAQMTTEQVDLLTGAFAIGAITLLLAGLKLELHPLPGTLALALAIGVKGSMFYFLPGLAIIAIVGIAITKPSLGKIYKYFSYILLTLALFSAPRYLENYISYDNPFAPKSEMERLHNSTGSDGFSLEKLRLNSICYLIQVLGPNSNPFGIYEILSPIGEFLGHQLPEEIDEHSVSRSRMKWFKTFQNNQFMGKHPLGVSTGALSFLLFVLGLAFAVVALVRTRNRKAAWILTFATGVICYHVFMAGFFKWSPFKFRYYLMIAPLLAIIGAYVFETAPKTTFYKTMCSAIGFLCLIIGFHSFVMGTSSGLGSIINKDKSLTHIIVKAQRQAVLKMLNKNHSVAVALPYYARLSGFFRNASGASITLLHPDELLDYKSAEAFLLTSEYNAVITKPLFWAEAGNRVTGMSWNIPGRGLTRDSFQIMKLDEYKEAFPSPPNN